MHITRLKCSTLNLSKLICFLYFRTDRECSFPGDLPIGYKSQCKQKYIYRKLVALNGTGQGVISDSFQFPSCCSCIIKLDHNLAHNRFAGGGGPLPLTLPKTTPTPSSLRSKNWTGWHFSLPQCTLLVIEIQANNCLYNYLNNIFIDT